MSDASTVISEQWSQPLAEIGLKDYESFMTLECGRRLEKPNLGSRQRIQISLTGPNDEQVTIFLKRYGQSGPELIERDAIATVRNAGINTMETIACGSGDNGGFIAVTCVTGQAMHDCFEQLLAQRAANDTTLNIELATHLATMAAALHKNGLAHRDFYTTHIFIDINGDNLKLSLIDLARIFSPKRFKWRWWIKDLAQLKFSLPQQWVSRNWDTVIAAYLDQRKLRRMPLLSQWLIQIKAAAMARSYQRRMKRLSREQCP